MPKITDLNVLTRAELSSSDKLEIVDVSDHTMAPTGTNKAITAGNLVGELLNAVPGTIVANAAVVADSSGQIAPGVGQTQLTTLDVEPGAWTSGKVLVVDTNGKLNSVSSNQFQALNVTAGSWTEGKALVVAADGKINSVSSNQFQVLNTTPGDIAPNKAVVPDSYGSMASSTISINTGDPGSIEILKGGTSVVITGDTITIADGTFSITVTKSSFVGSGSPFIVKWQGLPTSEVDLENYQLWVDELGYLRMKLPT
jgi:hypothetical protein